MRGYLLTILLWICSSTIYASETELLLYRPFGEATRHAPLIITEQRVGQCWQQSQRIKREDAWRCMAEEQIYDPCFVNPFGSQTHAVCPLSPWRASSVQLNLASPLDNRQHSVLDMSEAYPWAIELTNGEQCQALDEGGVFDGLPIHYQCTNQNVLIGRVQRCKPTWSMLERQENGRVETVTIAKAWF